MSDLAITLMRFGFLAALWISVFAIVLVLRRDLAAPREAKPANRGGAAPVPAAVPAQPKKGKGSANVPRKLAVIEGELAGTVVPLGTAPITVGRAPDSTLVLGDDYSSSRHARFFLSDGQWIVEDLGSTNGTWIEKTRISDPTVLRVGTKVKIGRTTLQLQR